MPINLLFLALARNCATTIPLFFDYLQILNSNGFCSAAIIGENGSTDRTRDLIEEMSGQYITILDTSCMTEGKSRLARMAVGRQALLDAARARGTSQDFVCVIDLDNVMLAPPAPSAVHTAIDTLRSDSTLFAIGASSYPVYYDLLSLRIDGGDDLLHLNRAIEIAKSNLFLYYHFHRDRIYMLQRNYTISSPVRCSSSFNGMCIYNASEYLLGSYRSHNESDVCEHVSFNLSIGRATSKEILISPKLLLAAPSDHIQVGFFKFWIDRLREQIGQIGTAL
jgi:hypothetical protein